MDEWVLQVELDFSLYFVIEIIYRCYFACIAFIPWVYSREMWFMLEFIEDQYGYLSGVEVWDVRTPTKTYSLASIN